LKPGIVNTILLALALPASAPAQRATATSKAPPAKVHLVMSTSGNSAHYTVRELLAANTIENDAVGSTTAIHGAITVDLATGIADSAVSQFTVRLDSLASDRAMRDRYVRGRTLGTDQYPTAVLTIYHLQGVPGTLPTSGTFSFVLHGNLTIHGVTKPSTWNVTAIAAPDGLTGSATTQFTFADFNMTQPSVPVVAHVKDEITLQYDFHLTKQ
jgi:polyisoprenoid-binding protein YceI